MAIDSRNIDTDLTLELDEKEIEISEFTSALEHFVGLVKEVTRKIVPRGKQEWFIKVYPGSAGIGLYGKPGFLAPGDIALIRQNILDGIESLEKGKRHPSFSDRAIEHARGISRVFEKRKKPVRIRIWNQNKFSYGITPAIGEWAGKFLDATYEDIGSIEGRLEVLSGHGKFEVVLYDPIDQRAIKCEISKDDIQTALNSFLRRVEVFGKIRYRKDGLPVSVDVDKIIPFPENPPPLEEVRGILRN